MTNTTYASFLSKIYGGKKRLPVSVYLELTHECNFNCHHCYLPREKYKKPLAITDYQLLCSNLEKMGVLNIVLTGGEVLIHPDFIDIYRLFKERGFLITVMTNGYAFTEELFDLFTDLPPKSIEISIYAMNQFIFSEYTQTNLAFEKVLSNIRRLAEIQIPLCLKTVLTNDNVGQLGLIQSFAIELGVHFRYDVRFHSAINGCLSCPDKLVETNQIADIDGKNIALLKEIEQKSKRLAEKPIALKQQTRKRFCCGIGLKSFVIDPSGYVHGCLLVRTLNWNLLDIPVDTIFTEYLPKLRGMNRSFDIPCDICNDRNLCLFCEGILWINNDKDNIIMDYCNITKNRLRITMGAI